MVINKDSCGSIELTQIVPLPLRAPSQPREGIASLFSRTAIQMGYKRVEWLLQPEVFPNNLLRYHLYFLRNRTAYMLLERLFNLSEETLYRLTFHQFAVKLQSPGEILTPSPEDIQRPLFR